MFNFFKKKPDEAANVEASSLTYYITDDDEIFCDVNLVDYSDESLKSFAKILVGIPSFRFQVQTIQMVHDGFLEADKVDEYDKLLRYVLVTSQQDQEALDKENSDKAKLDDLDQRQKSEEEPCIKPSDML
jgi:hypothetical protein